MHVSSSTISQAFANFSARGGSAFSSGQIRLGGSSGTAQTDSASFSPQSFAALMQGGGQPPQITDDQASQIGSMIQEQDPNAFSLLDADGNGSLTASELDAARKNGPPKMSDDQAAQFGSMIQQMDPNAFKQLDADGNGSLNAQEMEAAKENMGGKPPGGMESMFSANGQQDLMTNLLNDLLRGNDNQSTKRSRSAA
jgi:Ca2+-binding EF-hand superfamily protein